MAAGRRIISAARSDASDRARGAGRRAQARPDRVQRARRAGLAWRGARIVVSALLGSVALTLALVLLITFRLSLGPVELPFLARIAEAELGARLGTADLRVGGAVFVLGEGRDNPSGIRLTDVELRDQTGRLLISAPQIGARFRVADALLGDVRPTELFLFGARGEVTRDRDGRFDLSLLRSAAQTPEPAPDNPAPQQDAPPANAALVAAAPVEPAPDAAEPPDADISQDPATLDPRTDREDGQDRIIEFQERARREAEAEAEAEAEGEAAFAAFLASFARGDLPLLRELSSILLSDIHLVYTDDITGRRWETDAATLMLSRADTTLVGALRLRLSGDALAPHSRTPAPGQAPLPDPVATPLAAPAAMPAHAPTDLALDVRYVSGADAVSVVARFNNLRPDDLSAQIPALTWLRAVEAPLDGRLSLDLQLDGRLRHLTAELSAAPGRLAMGAGPGVGLNAARLDLAIDGRADRMVLTSLALDTEAGRLEASGTAELLRDGPTLTGLEARIGLDALALDLPGRLAAPVSFDGGALEIGIDLAPMAVALRRADLAMGDARFAFSGLFLQDPERWTGTLDFRGSALGVEDLLALWPIGPAPGARLWVETRLAEGVVDRVSGRLNLSGDAPDLDMVFDYRDGQAVPVPGLPAIEDASGVGHLTLSTFTVGVREGVARLPSGEIDLAGSRFHIPQLGVRPPTAEVSLRGTGPIEAALELIDRPPLGLLGRIGARPDLAAGVADVAAELSFPLLRKLTPAQVTADVEATLREVTVGLPAPLPIRASRLTLEATQKRMEVRGPLQLGPAQAQFAWTQVFKPEPGTPGGRMTAQLALTPALLASLGANLPPGVLTGPPAPARVTATLEKGRTRFALDADLLETVLATPGLGWRKPAGIPGRLQLSGQLQGGLTGGLVLDGIDLTAGELRVSGQ
ncbi:MAG: hypothetical protein AAFR46_13135, partial [Pseudomonadota bacterium]